MISGGRCTRGVPTYFDPEFNVIDCDDLDEIQHQIRALATDLHLPGFGLGRDSIGIAHDVYRALLTLRVREEQAREAGKRAQDATRQGIDEIAAERDSAQATVEMLREHLADAERRVSEAREAAADEEPWIWSDDDTDATIESLGNRMVVRITGGHLRALLARRDAETARIREELDIERGALSEAVSHASEEVAEADRWRERAEIFYRRIVDLADRLDGMAEKSIEARDRLSNDVAAGPNARKRWGHERAAGSFRAAAKMAREVLTGDVVELCKPEPDEMAALKGGACEGCGEQTTNGIRPCPHAQDIHGEDVPVRLCDGCSQERCDDC